MDVDLFQQAGINPGAINSPNADLFQAAGINLPQPQASNPSFFPRVGADVLGGLGQMGNGILNNPYNILNLPHTIANSLSSSLGNKVPAAGGNLTGVPQNYNYAKALGVNAPNIGDKLIQGAVQYSPYALGAGAALGASTLGEALSGMTSASLPLRVGIQGVTGADFGNSQSENSLSGAAIGAGFGAAGELAPAAFGAAKNSIGSLISKVQPLKTANSILQDLSGGNNLEQNSQSIAQALQNAFQTKKQQASALYQPVFDAAGNNKLYDVIDPSNSSYQNLDPSVTQSFGPALRGLHQDFLTNPTFNNAHELRSQLSSTVRQLQKNPAPDINTLNTAQNYQQAKQALSTDMNNYLSASDPNLASQYQNANNFYAQNVAPYKENTGIAKIATGAITNPRNIPNLFKNPEPATQQIVQDMGPQAANNLLYSQLGKVQGNLTPEKLQTAYNNLDRGGFSSYISPNVEQQFEQLGSTINNRDAAVKTFGLGSGALIGGHLGFPHAELVGAALGNLISKPLVKTANLMGSYLPQGSPSLMQPLSAFYRPGLNATTANLINNQQGSQ